MKSFRMLYEEEQKSEAQQALDALKAEVNTINEYLFKLLDKYTIAGGSYKYVCIIDNEKNVQWSLNKSGNLPQIEDNRKMLINAINEYDIFYKKIIAKSAALKKEKVLKEKSNPSRFVDTLDAFPFLEKAKFSADITNNINACKNVYEYMFNDINFASLSTMTNEKFYQEIQKIKNDLNGMSVDKILDETKIESELEDVPEAIKNDYKSDENKEEQPTEEVPEELKNNTEKVDDMVNALDDKIDDANFMNLISKTIEMNKKVNQELGAYLKEHPHSQIVIKQKEIVNDLGDISGQLIPTLWAKNTLLRMKDANESWNRHILLNVLDEAEIVNEKLNARQKKKMEKKLQQKQQNNNQNNQEIEQNSEQDNQDEKPEELNKKSTYLLNDGIAELMNSANTDEFKNKYVEWVKKINALFDEIKNVNNEEVNNSLQKYENSDDPLIKAGACAKAVEALTKNNEEKPEDKTNPTDKQGNSEADTAGSKPDSEDINDKEVGDGLTAESLEDEFIVHNFMKRLNERLRINI